MTLKLRFPPESNPECNRKEYTIHPKFIIPLGPGTIFILDPWDDLFFTHEAAFEAWLEQEKEVHSIQFKNTQRETGPVGAERHKTGGQAHRIGRTDKVHKGQHTGGTKQRERGRVGSGTSSER